MVVLEIVASKGLVKMCLRGGELPEQVQGYPYHRLDREEQRGILLSLRDGEELFPQGACCGVIPSRSVKCKQPIQDLRDLERLRYLQTQLLRAGVGLFHFGGTIPLRSHQRRTEIQVKDEFLAG